MATTIEEKQTAELQVHYAKDVVEDAIAIYAYVSEHTHLEDRLRVFELVFDAYCKKRVLG